MQACTWDLGFSNCFPLSYEVKTLLNTSHLNSHSPDHSQGMTITADYSPPFLCLPPSPATPQLPVPTCFSIFKVDIGEEADWLTVLLIGSNWYFCSAPLMTDGGSWECRWGGWMELCILRERTRALSSASRTPSGLWHYNGPEKLLSILLVQVLWY